MPHTPALAYRERWMTAFSGRYWLLMAYNRQSQRPCDRLLFKQPLLVLLM